MRALLLLLILLLLGGCAQQDMSDIKAFMQEVKAQPVSGVSPPPEPVEVESFFYVPAGRRDPFVFESGLEDEVQAEAGTGIQPDFTRRKEELERYPLDTLSMVGTLAQDGSTWGLVQTQDGTIHRVAPGNYMGQNHGRIVGIGEDKIELIELVKTGTNYQEQEAALGLGDSGN